jgi:aspartyl/asparaginyl beta-hydroxylase (cupin superfamily)
LATPIIGKIWRFARAAHSVRLPLFEQMPERWPMTAEAPQLQARRVKPAWLRPLTRFVKAAVVGVPLIYFLPKLTVLYALCGSYDVLRNKRINRTLLSQYFLGNGVFTWIISPINTVLDILCLPYWNKGVYKLEDLPAPYQHELKRVLDAAVSNDLVAKLEEKTRGQNRSMFFFKWYGSNVETDLKIPAFHENYKYVQTIGISVFNKREWTNEHFGFMRASLRVLYNINDFDDQSAYIQVGPTMSYWRDDKLFIFDDTLLHQSVNHSDKSRYCIFIDILRPSYAPMLLGAIIYATGTLSRPFNYIFYQKWKLIKA